MTKQIALVSGGTRGLGRAVASGLAKGGWVPVVSYLRDQQSAQQSLEELRKYTPEALAVQMDISSEDSVQKALKTIKEKLGTISVLINNAFRSGRKPVKTHDLSLEAFEEDLATNLTGHFLLSKACLPAMVEQNYGRIVFIGSLAARGEPGRLAYSVAKSGIIGLSKTIAKEYARKGITSNVVSPGFLEVGAFLNLSEEIKQRAYKTVPMRRGGQAEEIASMVAQLCRPESGYISGQVINVDGAVS